MKTSQRLVIMESYERIPVPGAHSLKFWELVCTPSFIFSACLTPVSTLSVKVGICRVFFPGTTWWLSNSFSLFLNLFYLGEMVDHHMNKMHWLWGFKLIPSSSKMRLSSSTQHGLEILNFLAQHTAQIWNWSCKCIKCNEKNLIT